MSARQQKTTFHYMQIFVKRKKKVWLSFKAVYLDRLEEVFQERLQEKYQPHQAKYRSDTLPDDTIALIT